MDGFCFDNNAQAVMNLIAILVATLVAGIGSVWIAALLLRLGMQRDDSAHGAQFTLLSLRPARCWPPLYAPAARSL